MAAATALAGGLLAGVGSGTAVADTAPFVQASGALSDLAPSTANVTDGASADLWAIAGGGYSTFVVFLTGLDPAAAGSTYGAHIHTGTCVAGNGAAAGPHYNTGGTPSPDTEVWLDFTVLPGGYGVAVASVPFMIPSGAAHAMVVHAEPTQADGGSPGAAGARMACLPVAL
jgi:Cu/Zn superoxide dismutase